MKSKQDKTVYEFFAGIGLVHEALRKEGWRCVYANDIDQKKRQMYEGHYGPSNHYHQCDIWNTEIVLDRMQEEAFLATASFPCTDMSLAGKMRGFDGAESSAFFGFLEILNRLGEKKPPLVLLENVTGFLHSHGGDDFATAAGELAKLGYWLDCFIIDARYFFAQSRQRLFLIGYHESIMGPPLVRQDEENSLFQDVWLQAIQRADNLRPKKLLHAMETMELVTGWATIDTGSPKQANYSLNDFLDTDQKQNWWGNEEVTRHYEMMFDRHKQKIDAIRSHRKQTVILTAFRRVREGRQRTEVRFDGIAGCLRTPRGGSAKQIVIVIKNGKLMMRWMSPREYSRLQGAVHYELPENAIQGLFGFGDAVCVPVIQWIDHHILTPVFNANQSRVAQKQNDGPVLTS